MLKRTCNYRRQKRRPLDPQSLDNEILYDHIPDDFLIADIKLNGARHLMFATTKQLRLLGKADVWYLDGTFDVIRDPYKQLYSIHAFVKYGDSIKQFPMVFIMMSRRQTQDYVAVIERLIQCITNVCGSGNVFYTHVIGLFILRKSQIFLYIGFNLQH